MNRTINIPLSNGATVTTVPRWQGAALAVHPPVSPDGETVTRGLWAITGHRSGLRAGTFHGPLKGAIALAKVWDAAFTAALAEGDSLATWPQRKAWVSQCDRHTAPIGPVPPDHTDYVSEDPTPLPRATFEDGEGGDQLPVTTTIRKGRQPGRVSYSRSVCGRPRLLTPDGAPCRMKGDTAAFKGLDPLQPVYRLWFAGKWHDVPTIAQITEWTLDTICPTPEGDTVEPDNPDSWLSLLGLI